MDVSARLHAARRLPSPRSSR